MKTKQQTSKRYSEILQLKFINDAIVIVFLIVGIAVVLTLATELGVMGIIAAIFSIMGYSAVIAMILLANSKCIK